MRRAAQVDGNQAEVVAALRKVGCTVQSLATVGNGCPDLVVGLRGRNVLIEVKPGYAYDKRQRQLNARESAWHQAWAGEVHTVLCPEDALRVMGFGPAVPF